MPGRPTLSEEAEREEREDRDRFYALETKLRELRSRRSRLLDEVHHLSDQQRALYEARQPLQAKVEDAHAEHRDLGHQLSELRRQRDAARGRMDEALAAVRSFAPVGPPDEHARGEPARGEHARGEPMRPEQIRREIQQLELRQQTTALPLTEENALIGHLRELTARLADAEKNRAKFEEHEKRRRELEEALRARRAEVDHLAAESARLRTERDRRMESMRAHLVEVGRLLTVMREKARARGEAMGRLDGLQREVVDLEREMDRLVARSRGRQREARATLREYSRPSRANEVEGAYARNAEAQLEELLKRGKITLGG